MRVLCLGDSLTEGTVGAGFVDIQAAFARHPGTEFIIGGAHLNNAGARLVAETFARVLSAD